MGEGAQVITGLACRDYDAALRCGRRNSLLARCWLVAYQEIAQVTRSTFSVMWPVVANRTFGGTMRSWCHVLLLRRCLTAQAFSGSLPEASQGILRAS